MNIFKVELVRMVCAGSDYPFLTAKERDIETGLDYFLARYYSSIQGRFTSPDEFTGGPDELFDFAETASANPTFYADLGNPQSLNKYQYTYNNPLNMVDPNGHCPTEPCAETTTINTSGPADIRQYLVVTAVVADIAISVGKVGANLGFGAHNIGAQASGGEPIQPYDSASSVQEVTMHALEVLTIVSPLLPKAGPTTMMAQSKPAVAVAAETASTLRPGASAAGSIPARSSQRNFNIAERASGNAIGAKSGCHTCGATTPGTRSGNWVLDHQPPTGVNTSNAAQRLFPQCLACSRRQGGDVNAWRKALPGSR